MPSHASAIDSGRRAARLRPWRAATSAVLDAEENVRFAGACSDVHMVIEAAAEITHVLTIKTQPPRDHVITRLIAAQPAWVQEGFSEAASGMADFDELHLWRQGGTYAADRPESRFEEDYLRRHVSTALSIARLAAHRCRPQGLDSETVRIFEFRVEGCETALNEPLRLPRAS